MKLLHSRLYPIFKTDVFSSSITSINQLVISIIEKSSSLFPNDEQEQKNFKGDALEIFAEFVLKYKGGDLRVAVTNYEIVKRAEDRGVDGWGIGNDGTDFAVQVKFRSNPMHVLKFKELATYFATAQRISAPRKVKNTNNLLIFSTADDIHYKLREEYRGIKTLCRKELASLFDNNNIFWQDFQTALRESCEGLGQRIFFEPKKHQASILTELRHFLNSEQLRCQILSATGSGKTFIEKEIAEEQIRFKIEQGKSSVIVCTVPRLALLQQIIGDFHDQKRLHWNFIKVGSGGIEELTQYPEDKEYKTLGSTTNPNEIVKEITTSLNNNKSIIIFSTYHSIERVGRALVRCNIEADLILADEAHNTVKSFRDVLENAEVPAKKRIFFTATQKRSESNNGFGMNNEELYGPVLANISAAELARDGLLCFPRLHFVEIDHNVSLNYDGSDEQLEDALKIIISSFTYHQSKISNEVRFIIACKSAEQAHLLAESPDLANHLPEVYKEAITTHERMDRSKKRTEIFAKFKQQQFAILFHYDIISEGVDLPGATAVISLRKMGDIKTVQFIGRILRLHPVDRTALEDGNIPLPFAIENWQTYWQKPFGYVIIPVIKGSTLIDWSAQLFNIVRSLRIINFMPYELIGEDTSLGSPDEDPEFPVEVFTEPEMINSFHIQDSDIKRHISHILENVENALKIKPAINPLDLVEWESIIEEEFTKYFNN